VLLDLARPLLRGLFDDLEKAAARDLSEYDNLHQVRIAGKRLRYALEVFESCFGKGFRKTHYAAVEQLQEILGDANDSHVAVQRLGALAAKLKASRPPVWRRCRAGIDGLVDYHRRRLPERAHQFEEWWHAWHASNAKAALEAMLEGR
jgi:CHAD domain-containing protein